MEFDNNINTFPVIELFRSAAVEHINADENIELLAYRASGSIDFLPKNAKDIFIF